MGVSPILRASVPALVLSVVLAAGGQDARARPLITGSEDTTARLCRAFDDSYRRLVDICRDALTATDLTAAERSEFLARLADALWHTDARDAAEAQYLAAVEADPRNVAARNGLGWIYWYEDAYDRAIGAFESSVALRPTAEGLAGLGSARWYAGQADAAAALELLDAALAIAPDYAWALREKGWVLFDSGRNDEAAESFRSALVIDADSWNAHYGLGRALSRQGEPEAALAAFGQAIRIDPDPPWAYGQRAHALRMLGRNNQAITDAERMIARAPADSMGHTQKALALDALGRRATAVAAFEAGIAAGAGDDFLLYWYADMLCDDGQYARAGELIDRAILQAPGDAYSYELKAYIALMQDAYPDSLAAAERAVALDGGRVLAHYYAAAALVYSGQTEAGIARFDRGIAAGLEPDVVGRFAADLIAAGAIVEAIRLRARY
jgi:tetratricopeptide (TPR) repeat protein